MTDRNDSLRYQANFGILDESDMKRIQKMTVMIVGLGGLGGHVASSMMRLGVTKLTLVDPDVFDETNLNRQLFCEETTIGYPKVEVAKDGLLRIDSNAVVRSHDVRVEDLDPTSFHDVDVLVDAVDDIATKRHLEELGTTLGIPVLHGACAGWYGQVGWLAPGSTLLRRYYGDQAVGAEETLMNPAFTPAVVANVMVAEFVKRLQSANLQAGGLILIDLANGTIERILDQERV